MHCICHTRTPAGVTEEEKKSDPDERSQVHRSHVASKFCISSFVVAHEPFSFARVFFCFSTCTSFFNRGFCFLYSSLSPTPWHGSRLHALPGNFRFWFRSCQMNFRHLSSVKVACRNAWMQLWNMKIVEDTFCVFKWRINQLSRHRYFTCVHVYNVVYKLFKGDETRKFFGIYKHFMQKG